MNLISALYLSLLLLVSVFAYAEQKTVCNDCEFKTVGSAVLSAKKGDVVLVKQGTYAENLIGIDKEISIRAEGHVVIDGKNENKQIFVISKADNVVISGFQIMNTGMSYTQELAGVRVIESKGCHIENNTFTNTTYAVYLDNSHSCVIKGNKITGDAKDEASGGNGVHVWYGGTHYIEENDIRGHRDGIYLEFATGTIIKDNFVHGNLRYGLHFMSSSQTEYHRNTFTENGAGVAVMYSRQIKMYNNRFIGNTGPAAYGLLFKEVHDSEIFNNEMTKNTVGIFMEGSNRSNIKNNLIADNGWALRIMGDCENNVFTENNFINNTFDVTTNSDHSWNTFTQNYWSQYSGYDLDRDGVGDVPYRPVSLSSVILERVDSSYILMNSFFFNLMDQVERALPSLIPEPLKDEKPLMNSVKAGILND